MKCLIFDLDQTLIDSQSIEHLRRLRQWAIVYQKIPTIFAYEGIDRVLSIAKEKNIKISIVSSSPSSYVQKVVRNLGWSFDAMICYCEGKSQIYYVILYHHFTKRYTKNC
jgi:phosphoserine phosphatase